jgi:hypothetical protein
MSKPPPSMSTWLALIRAEYREMPGLCLTKPQARRLWGLDQPTCDELLEELETAGFLKRTSSDCYVLERAAPAPGSPRPVAAGAVAKGEAA